VTAAVLCTGTELTRGELVNTNATWLCEALTTLGFEVGASDAVDDDPDRIQSALARLGAAHDVLVCTGGLGPTTDDLTSACVASVLCVELVRDEGSLRVIEQRLARLGRNVAASNAKQADFPRGAAIIENQNGTAPGFAVTIGRARSFFLPGVPLEMRAMFQASVVPALAPLLTGGHHQVRLRTYGLPESEVNDRLGGIEAAHDVTIGYRAHLPEIEVKVLARAEGPALARQRAEAAAKQVRERLGDEVVFGEGDVDLALALGQLLLGRGLTLAAAESCTGGLVSELLTDHAGASRYFLGAVIAYDNRVKEQLLGVPRPLLDLHGAVSAEVAAAMADGARQRSGSSLGVAVTGIAGPGGGSDQKPVGLVHFAVSDERGATARHKVFSGNRQQIRRRAAFAALALCRRVLLFGHG
jgi:nicotinamide-nucleotide amidase